MRMVVGHTCVLYTHVSVGDMGALAVVVFAVFASEHGHLCFSDVADFLELLQGRMFVGQACVLLDGTCTPVVAPVVAWCWGAFALVSCRHSLSWMKLRASLISVLATFVGHYGGYSFLVFRHTCVVWASMCFYVSTICLGAMGAHAVSFAAIFASVKSCGSFS